jgi:TetR/AcrR family transcriptional repressor of nem operon
MLGAMKHGVDTRQRLLDAANELMWTQSYGAVSVDDICEKAGVRKGSFYHFFPSKVDLAVAAIEDYWQQMRPKLDQIFSPQLAPLERLEAMCKAIYERQREKREITGKVCGCPYGSLGSEQSTREEAIRRKTTELFDRMRRYLEATLRDAMREGAIAAGDPVVLARAVHSLIEGTLLEAKVQNDLEVLRGLKPAIFRLLGARETAATR